MGSTAHKASGLANEAMGEAKQGVGKVDQGADLERRDQWRRRGAHHGDDYAHGLA